MLIVKRGDADSYYRAEPFMLCDVCGEPITNTGLAMVVWFRDINPGEQVRAFVCHKITCDQALIHAKGRDKGWYELSSVLRDLGNNTPKEPEAEAVRAEIEELRNA